VDTSLTVDYQRKSVRQRIKESKAIYAFVLPAFVYFVVFRYMPIYFIQVAFTDYRPTIRVWESVWIGLDNFRELLSTPGFLLALRNTFIIAFYKIVFGFPIPIILAIMINEVRSRPFKRVTQTLVYLPHFISWSVIGGIMYSLLSVETGVLNELLKLLGADPVFFLGDRAYFRGVLVVSDIWKSMGWGTVLYLAAITNIDPQLYEAATIDGAGRFQRIYHITLSGIRSTIVVLLIIRLGNILEVGFEQILVLGNSMVRPVADVLDTFVYRVGLQQGRHSVAAAAGLFKTLVAGVLVIASDRASKLIGDRGLL
jgi:putative aldouronate transport system permease protein